MVSSQLHLCHVALFLDKTLYYAYLCLVDLNKQQNAWTKFQRTRVVVMIYFVTNKTQKMTTKTKIKEVNDRETAMDRLRSTSQAATQNHVTVKHHKRERTHWPTYKHNWTFLPRQEDKDAI